MSQSSPLQNYGVFLDFPTITHFVRRIRHGYSDVEFRSRLSKAIIKLNQYEDTITTSSAGRSTPIEVTRSFEVGIADGLEFMYLDEKEAQHLQSMVTKRSIKFLDLVLFIHYRYRSPHTQNIASLRFDQYFLRIGFKGAVFTFFHVKGLKRTPPESVLEHIVRSILENP